MSRKPLRVALTGGIATGKSYVLARFARLGIPTIDADRLARAALAPGSPGAEAVGRRFGAGVLHPDGSIDRQRLGALVFADADARAALEAIVHPEVYRGIETWFTALAAAGAQPLAVADIPLLYETGRAGAFDRVVVAACRPETQIRRLMSRDGLSEAAGHQRLAAQWSIEEKTARADYVIRTDEATEETDRQVEAVYRALLDDASRSESGP